ncbi:hypothetical protein SBP28_000176 [Candidozyma auris]|nr:hypothetical protein CJJ09_000201 [[Candida] auris]
MQLLAFFFFVLSVTALPINKRLYKPSSPVFSVIAHHEGAVFQYHLLKIKASNNYILNLPGSNKSANATQIEPKTTSVIVDPDTFQLSTTKSAVNASSGFGIDHQKLTYKNSSQFLACPANTYRGEYYVHWGNHNRTECPNQARGYQIELIVQSDDAINYNPETNKLGNSSLPLIPQKKKRFLFF